MHFCKVLGRKIDKSAIADRCMKLVLEQIQVIHFSLERYKYYAL